MKIDLGGTVRGRDAGATLAWIRPLFPRFGITRVANVTGLDRIGIPVWLCVRPNGRSLSVSQGKGVTPELAQASAVMESIEVFHAEHLPAPELVASYRAVRRRHAAIAPRQLQPGIRSGAYDDTRPIGWMRGTELSTGEPVLVPRARLDLNWSHPHPDCGLFFATSTGLASGNERSEALCHAIYEAVERDAEWRWEQLAPRAQAQVLLHGDSVDAPVSRGLLDRFAGAAVSVRAWDITSDVGLPAYRCVITDGQSPGTPDGFTGFGCHVSKDVALARALTEAAQSRLTYIAGSRDDIFPDVYDALAGREATRPRSNPRVDFRTRRAPRLGATFDDDLNTTLELLRAAGFPRVVAVDHTREELGIPVVSAVVPGLRETESD